MRAHLGWVVLLFGCHGVLYLPSSDTGGPSPYHPTDQPVTCTGSPALAGESQRLTAVQLTNALTDVLGFSPALDPGYPDAQRQLGYSTYPETNRINGRDVGLIADTADSVALQAMDHFDALLPCDPGSITDACASTFVDDFAPRALRGTYEASDGDLYHQLYQTLRAGSDPLEPGLAIAGVISAILQSPGFLYLVEQGTAVAAERVLTSQEIANRIAFLFSDAPPDAVLLADATTDSLQDPAHRRAHAERLLAEPAARAPVVRFFREWFGAGMRDLSGTVSSEVAGALDEELRRQLEELIFESGPDGVRGLVSADFTYLNPVLADHYALSAPSDWQRVTLPDSLAAGLLTRGAVAAAHSTNSATSIVRRGHFVRTTLLCDAIGNPPPNAMAQQPVLPDTATVRERSEARRANSVCAGCHAMMDTIGLGMEEIDNLGRLRTQYLNGQNVDNAGLIATFEDTAGNDVVFQGTHALGQTLATSDQYLGCAVRQWFRYAMGRAEIDCQADAIHQRLAAAHYDLRELLLLIVESDSFTHRTDTITP